MQEKISIYHAMLRIRRFEETVLEQFSKGHFYGTTHTYLGQEANAVGVLKQIRANDVVVSNHRGHGHFLAYGGDMRALFAELMGRASGVGGGWGGSQHLQWRNFYSNGILGGTAPLATGMAMAEKLKDSGAVTICFLGDGALGEGVVYEALNMASLWSLPILFVLENNRIAQSTPIQRNLAGKPSARFAAFGIPVIELDSSDVLVISQAAGEGLQAVRAPSTAGERSSPRSDREAGQDRGGPRALILNTQRFGPHSKGDDSRPAEEIEKLRLESDPLKIHGRRLGEGERIEIEDRVQAEVRAAFEAALADPIPAGTSLLPADGDLPS